MDRRQFFQRVNPFQSVVHHPAIQKAMHPRPLNVESGLEPYRPGEKLTDTDALHLLRRCCFQPTPAAFDQARQMTVEEAVNHLLRPMPLPPYPEWYETDPLSPQQVRQLSEQERREYTRLLLQNFGQLVQWWYHLMITMPFSLREKMVFFFHNHFTSAFLTVRVPHYMLMQNMLFRQYAWGNLKELTVKIVFDPAMLVYLDGNVNTLRRPNENFGRELLELFTMGEGNYTEWDIVEVSRVCTGWFNTYQKPYYDFDRYPKNPRLRRHDYLSKIVFGEIIDPQVSDQMSVEEIRQRGMEEVSQLIDLIFRQQCDESRGYDPSHPYYGRSVTAVFFAEKLYRYFVYEHLDQTIVAQLADLLVENQFELKPVLKTLLQSAHFFDAQFRGAQIKSPLDFTVGLFRLYDLFTQYGTQEQLWQRLLRTVRGLNDRLGLALLQPPDVSGWKGYHDWINTYTYPYRNMISNLVIRTERGEEVVPVYNYSQQFSAFQTDVRQFVTQVTTYLLAFPPLGPEFDTLVETLLDGAPDYEWPSIAANPDTATPRLQQFYQAVMQLPQFQLM